MAFLRFTVYERMAFITLWITATNAVVVAGVCDCGGDWVGRPVTNGCHCYQGFTASVKQWLVARDQCQHLGGDLASITSTEEYEFIGQYLSDIEDFTTWWVGLSKGGDGVWKWSTGEQLSDDIEVSDGTGSSDDGCGDIEVFVAFIVVWKSPCTGSESKNYVCEVILLETTTSDLFPTTSDAITTSHQITTSDAITTSQQITTSNAITTTQQVTTSDAITTSQQITTSDAITTSQQVTSQQITTSDAITTSQPVTTSDVITTSQHVTTSDAKTTTQLVTTSDAITTSQQVTNSDAITTSQQVTTSDAITTSQQVMTSDGKTTRQPVTTGDAITTSQQVTTSDAITTSQQVSTRDAITTSKQVTTSDGKTTSQQVTTSDAITTSQPVTTNDAIKNSQQETTSDAITTTGQVTTTKTAEKSKSASGDNTVYLYTIVTGGIVLIFTILSLTVCYVAKNRYRQILPLESRPVRHTNQHVSSGITMASKPRFPAPPKRVNTNLFDIEDGNIIPSHLPPDITTMDTKLTQNAKPLSEDFNVSSVRMTKGLPVSPTCSREPTIPPNDTVQQTDDAKNLYELFNRPGSLQPPHHEQTAQPKADPYIDSEDIE